MQAGWSELQEQEDPNDLWIQANLNGLWGQACLGDIHEKAGLSNLWDHWVTHGNTATYGLTRTVALTLSWRATTWALNPLAPGGMITGDAAQTISIGEKMGKQHGRNTIDNIKSNIAPPKTSGYKTWTPQNRWSKKMTLKITLGKCLVLLQRKWKIPSKK